MKLHDWIYLWIGGAVTSRLVRMSPDRAVWVRALAGDTVLCSWARHLTLIVPLSTQEYKRLPANCWGNLTNCGGVTCDGLASHPGGVEILLATSCYRNRDKLRQLWASRLQGFTFFTHFTAYSSFKVAYYSFSETQSRALWLPARPSVLIARAKMVLVTLIGNENHFSTWKALNHLGIRSESFKFRSNMCLSLGPKKYDKKTR